MRESGEGGDDAEAGVVHAEAVEVVAGCVGGPHAVRGAGAGEVGERASEGAALEGELLTVEAVRVQAGALGVRRTQQATRHLNSESRPSGARR